MIESVNAFDIQFDVKSQYQKNNQSQFQDLEANTVLSLSDQESALVTTSNSLPILIYGVSSQNSKMEINQNTLKALTLNSLKIETEAQVNQTISTIRKAEFLIQKRNYAQALDELNQGVNQNKNISELYFLRGTVQYLLKNNELAKVDLQKGLEISPNHETARKLLNQLKEKK